jgi:hypothetical protein
LGQEKSNEELENTYKEKIQSLTLEKDKLSETLVEKNNRLIQACDTVQKKEDSLIKLAKLHNSMLKKQKYHKFKKGPCFYIWRNPTDKIIKYKVGFTENINSRLRQYRTAVPNLILVYLIYLPEAKFIEDAVLLKYRKNRVPLNHEIVHVSATTIIKSVENLVKYFKFQNTVEGELWKYNEKEPDNLVEKDINDEDSDEDTDDDSEETTEYFEKSEIEKQEEEIKKKQEQTVKCQICEMEVSIDQIKQHIFHIHKVTFKDNGRSCSICKKTFANKPKRDRHVNTVHKKLGRVECELCGNKYATKDSLNYHIRNVHDKKYKSTCGICNMEFTNENNMKIHIENQHKNPDNKYYTCPTCNKDYVTKSGLTSHIQKIHKRKEKSNCKICGKLIMSKAGMSNHIRSIHPDK